MAKGKPHNNANSNGAGAYEKLRSDIAARHSTLSDRLRHIAEFALENPTEMALGTVAEVAKRAAVQPSAIVRFASALGYSGFTEMQQVFRLRLVASLAPSYKDRIGRLKHDGPWRGSNEPQAVLGRFVSEGIASLETLNSVAREQDLRRAIDLLGCASSAGAPCCSTRWAAACASRRWRRPAPTRCWPSASSSTMAIRFVSSPN